MRKITQEATEAFLNGLNYKKTNTEVKVLALEKGVPCCIALFLHGHKIAELHKNKRVTRLKITNCNYFTDTTKERLNGLPNVQINQKQGVWYLNGKAWNGELITIKQ